MKLVTGKVHRFIALDGWRGICALIVAIGHFGRDDHFRAIPVIRNSYLCVDFFFVLSGFVVCHAYAGKLGSPGDVKNFVIRRFGRLWPLHMATLLAFLLLFLVTLRLPGLSTGTGKTSFASFVSNVFLLQAFGLHDTVTWNYPSWSISAEFYTYLLFAALAYRGMIRIVPCLLLCIAAFLAIWFLAPHRMDSTYDLGAVCRCVYGFFAGCIAYRLRVVPIGTRWSATLEWLAIIAVGTFISYAARSPWETLSPVLFGVTVWLYSKEAGLLSRAFASRPIAALGRWSYSIYMVHAIVAVLIFNVIRTAATKFGFDVYVNGKLSLGEYGDILTMGYVFLVLALSATTYRLIELPGQRLFNRYADRSVDRGKPADAEGLQEYPPA